MKRCTLLLIGSMSLGWSTVTGQTIAVCGNGILEGAEQCDDGNNTNLDGCSAQCKFEQSQRINQMKVQFGTDTVCTQNAFGSAFASAIQSQVQTSLDASVKNGTTSIILTMLGSPDLTGTNGVAEVGIVNGTPATAAGVTYDGNNDLDWWYGVDAYDIDASRVPRSKLVGFFTARKLSTSPGEGRLVFDITGAPRPWQMSSLHISAYSGASTTPLTSTGAVSPGHVAAERLVPTLTSYASSGASISGEMCGNVRASSLAGVPIAATLLTGTGACTEGYTAASSLLDVIVGGCHALGGFITEVVSRQPDASDGSAPVAGAGPPYVLLEANHVVTSCKDKNGAVASLTTCLNSAAYSSFFKFSTDRTIIGGGTCNMLAPTASNNGSVCPGQTLQLSATGPSGSYQWSGPNNFSSTLQNPTIPNVTSAAQGTYSVTVSVSGCASAAGTTTVTVNASPAKPSITAPSGLVAGATGIASVALHQGNSYDWTITNGALSIGQGTNQISFSAGASGVVSIGVIETGSACPSAQGTATTAIVEAPQSVTATASTGIVNVSWPASVGAAGYEVARRDPAGTYNLILATAGLTANDNTVSANTAYLYKVRAVDSVNNRSAYTNVDLATTVLFAEDPLVAQVTTVKASQLTELRTAVAAVRTLAGLPSFSFSNPAIDPSVKISASHVSELRTALDEARSALVLPALSYTDSPLIPGTLVKATHVREIRNGVR